MNLEDKTKNLELELEDCLTVYYKQPTTECQSLITELAEQYKALTGAYYVRTQTVTGKELGEVYNFYPHNNR